MDNEQDGKIIKVDKCFTEITGYTMDDVNKNNLTIFGLVPEINRKEYRMVLEGLAGLGEGYLSHDICCKDGKVITVNCFGEVFRDELSGHIFTKVLIVDITKHTTTLQQLSDDKEKLELQIEKVKFLMKNIKETLFDYDIQNDHLEISTFINGDYKVLYVKDNYLDNADGTIYADDFEMFCESLLVAGSSNNRAAMDFRVRFFSDDYRWNRFIYTKYINPKTGKTHIIGKMEDIHAQKIISLHGEDNTIVDALTGVYNKEITENKINDILYMDENEHSHTLLLIDVDHLKSVNDELMYQAGDMILSRIGYVLCDMFRQNFDIIGRVSGDAFVVFLRNTRDVGYVESQCGQIRTRLVNEFDKINKNSAEPVTVSIGIALGDAKADTYKKLYKKAEKALQSARKNGRNGYSF